MSVTTCPTCRHETMWSWTEAFEKFGFEDGDGLVMTEHVAEALRKHGYKVTTECWGCHNMVITSIRTAKRKEVIPETVNLGYEDPRKYLPRQTIKLLDNAVPDDAEVEL